MSENKRGDVGVWYDLIDVCRVNRGSEEFNGDFVTVGGRDGVLVQASSASAHVHGPGSLEGRYLRTSFGLPYFE